MEELDLLIKEADRLRNQGRSLEAIKKYQEAISIARKLGNEKAVAFCYQQTGVCWKIEKDISNAVDNYQKAVDAYRSIGDNVGYGATLRDLGIVYEYHDQDKKALEFLKQSEKVLQATGNKTHLGITKTKIGLVLTKLRRFDEAEHYFSDGIELIRTANKYSYFMEMTTYLNWAQLDFAKDDASNMINKLWAAYGLITCYNEEQTQLRRIAQIMGLLAQGYFMLGQYKESLRFFKKSLELLSSMSDKARGVVLKDFKADKLLNGLKESAPDLARGLVLQ